MPMGNEDLEEMIRSETAVVPNLENDEDLYHIRQLLLNLDDAYSVEVARMAVMNLAYRHAGFYEQADTMSLEGMAHSTKRVLKLMGESVDGH